ncbi:ABC transporter substrate-binding protein [Abyssalbus ytuae]|uniref:ABC transporter substrate-binding protein n=1 Tax=Abyssalbus ytuae TaxID=2926907 RepID=A0A9E7CTK5_9FLAO|nr:ABC transporter substrate-binding protein [Abyssalbus ytuae]UOB18236.1 ABC transporter substrate-binding protein [Abyssalbus ytuae]
MIKYRFINLQHLIVYFSISCAFAILLSCRSNENSEKDRLVFRYNEHTNILSLDPAFARVIGDIWAVNQLFNGLVQLDDSLNVKPDIAKRWEIKDSALTYSFVLRNDVFFHKHELFGKDSTRLVHAQDFEYSFNRLSDGKVASPGKWVMNYIESFKAENDSVFTIHLKQPFPAFLGLLTNKYCSVVPKEIAEYYGSDFRRNPIGTGPFKFKLWEENVKLVLRRNPLYYEKDSIDQQLPYLEAVAITFLPDKQSEFLQFIQGNLDFLNYLDASYKDELLTTTGSLQPKYKKNVKMITAPYLNTEYLGIYMESSKKELASNLFRKALNYGFDREKMVTYLRNGIVTPAINGFIPKGLPGFNNLKGYTYNPQKATQLIREYKALSGNPTPEITITTDANYVDVCEFIQREIEKTGVKVNIDVVPSSTLRQSKATGKLDIFRASWIADYPDAENYLSLFYSKNFIPNGPNYTHFKDSLFDDLYEKALTEVVPETRYELYQKMDSLIIAKAPVIPLYYDQAIRFTRKNVTGLGSNPINLLNLKTVKKTIPQTYFEE